MTIPPRQPTPRLALALATLLAPNPATAAASFTSPHATARLLAETSAYTPSQPFRIGLAISLAPGWHTYWSNPGDAGAPPTFNIAPASLQTGPLQLPLPQLLHDDTGTSIGYTNSVLLARTVTANTTGPLTLSTNASWIICRQVCIPQHATLAITLPQGQPTPSPNQALFAATTFPTATRLAAHLTQTNTLVITDAPPGPAIFLPDTPGILALNAPQQATRSGRRLSLALTPAALFNAKQPLAGLLVVGTQGRRAGFLLIAKRQ